MIVGIGTDLVEIKRVEKACSKEHFFTRCFSVKERNLIGKDSSKAAGNWAVKEAIAKAFGTGINGFDLDEITVLRDDKGAPFVNLEGKAKDKAKELGIKNIHISISNTKEYAVAYVICES